MALFLALLVVTLGLWAAIGLVCFGVIMEEKYHQEYSTKQAVYIFFLCGPFVWIGMFVWFCIIKPAITLHRKLFVQLGH